MGYIPKYTGAWDLGTPSSNSYYTSLPSYSRDNRGTFSDLGTDFLDNTIPLDSAWHDLWTNGTFSIQMLRNSSTNRWRILEISSGLSAVLGADANEYCNHMYITVGYDESTNLYAQYYLIGAYYEGIQYYDSVGNVQMTSEQTPILTRFFENTPIITYTWQSVPSVSGKNGILSLVTLDSESINDGEPVSGAAVSVFDQAPSNDNNIKNLADTYGGGEESSAVDVTVKYKVTLPPGGSFSTLKIVAKKDSIPNDVSDGDKIVDISPSKTKKTVTGLDENSLYYFKIFAEDTNSNTSESDEKHIMTSGDEGWTFDYTGEIQTFVAPKTGIYSLETWGAQGGDATDGTNTARGGYGAYAVGEVFLTQGETLYINVGGQNGYGGGGNYVPPYIEIEPSILDNNIFVSSQSDAGYSPSSYGANYYITLFPDTVSHFDNAKCILTGQQNKSAYTHTTDGQGNDIMSYSNNNTYSISVLAIPLGDLYDVSKIAFSYKIDTSGYEYKFINMWTANIDTSTGSVIESVSIFADNESKSWTDTEVNVNKQMNYLIVQTCNGQNALKDIKVYL